MGSNVTRSVYKGRPGAWTIKGEREEKRLVQRYDSVSKDIYVDCGPGLASVRMLTKEQN